MAYKYESEQQFMESIVRQIGDGLRRPTGDQAYGEYAGNSSDMFGDTEQSPMGLNRGMGMAPPTNKPLSQIGDDSAEAQDAAQARADMAKVKQAIKETERQLHELQRKKVELMRKITGRL